MRHPRRIRWLLGSTGGLALLAAAPAVAQEPPESIGTGRSLWATAQLRWTVHDNYFQAPAGRPDSVVQATAVLVRVVGDAAPGLGAQLYAEGGFTTYDTFEPTFGVGAGVRAGPPKLRVDVGAGYDRNLPRLDLGDSFARADVARGHAEARLRLGRALELTGLGRGTWQAVLLPEMEPVGAGPDPREEWENFTYLEIEGRARTRILGRLLSPEVGIGWGRPWTEEGSVFLHEQKQWQIQIRSAPMAPVYLSARYRVRERSYPHAPESSSSFGRKDRRRQLAVSLDFRVAERLTWNIYYTQEHAHSSLANRSFRTRAISLGMTIPER